MKPQLDIWNRYTSFIYLFFGGLYFFGQDSWRVHRKQGRHSTHIQQQRCIILSNILLLTVKLSLQFSCETSAENRVDAFWTLYIMCNVKIFHVNVWKHAVLRCRKYKNWRDCNAITPQFSTLQPNQTFSILHSQYTNPIRLKGSVILNEITCKLFHPYMFTDCVPC